MTAITAICALNGKALDDRYYQIYGSAIAAQWSSNDLIKDRLAQLEGMAR